MLNKLFKINRPETMKYIFLFFCLTTVFSCLSQIDSTVVKKENRFKVAGSVLANSVLSVPSDFSEMGHTVSSDWKRSAIVAGSIVGLIAADKITTSFLHDHIEPNIDYSLPRIDAFKPGKNFIIYGDNAYILYPIVGLYTGSFLLNHKKGQVVALNAVKSITYSYLISHLLLKTITGRNRPQRRISDDNPVLEPWTKDPWDFGNFHPVAFDSQVPGTAMPSFHATFYFSVAKVFQMEYDNYWIPYSVATIAFFSNLKGHNHWVSDLLVGGLVGTIIGKSVVKSSRRLMAKNNSTSYNYNPKKFKMTKQFVPQISTSMVGFHFSGTF